VIITVLEELPQALPSNRCDGYCALLKTAAKAIIEFARDLRFVAGAVGVLAVLHTWTQQLLCHPHVHFRVAITNPRIIGRDEQVVTIRHQQRKSSQSPTCRVTSEEFIRLPAPAPPADPPPAPPGEKLNSRLHLLPRQSNEKFR
jgi:hypothetical protein